MTPFILAETLYPIQFLQNTPQIQRYVPIFNQISGYRPKVRQVWQRRKGRLIGDGLYFTIADVVVHPAFQHQKIGTAIFHELLEHVEKCTFPGGRSSVFLIVEKGKEPFYEKPGFKRVPHEFCGSGMRKVIYKGNETVDRAL